MQIGEPGRDAALQLVLQLGFRLLLWRPCVHGPWQRNGVAQVLGGWVDRGCSCPVPPPMGHQSASAEHEAGAVRTRTSQTVFTRQPQLCILFTLQVCTLAPSHTTSQHVAVAAM